MYLAPLALICSGMKLQCMTIPVKKVFQHQLPCQNLTSIYSTQRPSLQHTEAAFTLESCTKQQIRSPTMIFFRKVCILSTALMRTTLAAIQSQCYCITILNTLWQMQHIFITFLRMVSQLSIEIQLSLKLSQMSDDGHCTNSCNFLILLSSYNVTFFPLYTAITRNFDRCAPYLLGCTRFIMTQRCSNHLKNVTSYG
jgi:hypothetical protein